MANWYAVRSNFHFGKKSDGRNVFEERIVVFRANDPNEAFAKAEKESDMYAEANQFKVHPDMEAYDI